MGRKRVKFRNISGVLGGIQPPAVLYRPVNWEHYCTMGNGITGVDHTLVGVEDLEAGRKTYERLGFTVTPRGSHIGWGTANYCIMFPDNYVELLGIVDSGQFTAGLDEILAERGEGLIGLALQTRDSGESQKSLVANGFDASDVQDLSRNLELPEGTVQPRFRLVHLPADETAGVRTFLCQHLDPDMVRRPDWLRHANGTVNLASVAVLVDEPESLYERLEKLYGSGTATTTDDCLAVHAGRTTIFFVTPTDLDLLYPDVVPGDAPATPVLVAMGFAVADTSQTARWLAQQGIAHHIGTDGAVRVPADQACGVILEFASARERDTEPITIM
jgi:hypothetical protein